MKKKCLSLLVALAMMLSMTTALVSASEVDSEQVQTRGTAVTNFATLRISNTKAAAELSVYFSKVAEEYQVVITLQKKSNGSWVTASDVSGNTIIYKGKNSMRVYTSDTWTVKKGVLYRVKCKSTDSYSNGSYFTSTNYSDPF
ncbi:hypothetical protein M2140_002081 [Clostridiales Family XIII bacterium PM5-7]